MNLRCFLVSALDDAIALTVYTLSIILVSLIPGKSASHPCSKSGYPAKRTGIYMSFFPLYVRSSVNLKDNRHYKLINRLIDIIWS